MKLYDPSTLKGFLGRHGVKAEKGLGQHFLCSRRVVETIVEALAGCSGLLEIGPGPGVLTSPLSEQSMLTALELDERMVSMLAESAPKANVLREDALKAAFSQILSALPEPRGVVSNLPYYITGPLLTRISEHRDLFTVAVLMMQKEVAERVVAKPSTSARGSLSVFLQTQFEIDILIDAPSGCFLPPPKVESTVLRFIPKPIEVETDLVGPLFRLIRTGFTQPRKTLANNLAAGYQINKETANQIVDKLGLSETIRPQQLSNEDWTRLVSIVVNSLGE